MALVWLSDFAGRAPVVRYTGPMPDPTRDAANESTDASEPVVVAFAASEIEAAIIRSALEAEGIPAWVVGGLTAGMRAEAPGQAKILVRAQDAERAKQILAEEPNEPRP